MKKLFALVVVVLVGYFGVKWARENFGGAVSADKAERRVTVALEGMKSGGDEQAAASMFLEGVMNISEEAHLTQAYDRWMRWRREKDLGQEIGRFSVDGSDTSGDVTLVDVTIDGRDFQIEVPAKGQLAWAE